MAKSVLQKIREQDGLLDHVCIHVQEGYWEETLALLSALLNINPEKVKELEGERWTWFRSDKTADLQIIEWKGKDVQQEKDGTRHISISVFDSVQTSQLVCEYVNGLTGQHASSHCENWGKGKDFVSIGFLCTGIEFVE